jgi:vancomycin resistance protein YoaR
MFSDAVALPSQVHQVSLPFDFDKPVMAKKAISEETSDLLWEGSIPLSSHGGSTAENIAVAAEAIDMTIVHPNETFSFNDTVGVRTEEKGYKPGPMYAAGEKIVGVGGGICMVSTILYNAALETGLKIIERHPHSGPVSYAEPGRDAAVSFGLADLCFKNDTKSALLLRAGVKDDELSLRIYGKEIPGRTVEIVAKDYEELPYKIFEKEDESVPEGQVVVKQKARPGFSVTIVRLIKQNGKLVKREVVNHDTTLPANKIVMIPLKPKDPTGKIGQSPAIMPTLSQEDANIRPQPSTGGEGHSDASGRDFPTNDRTTSKPRE